MSYKPIFKISLIGLGRVGSSIAFSLLLQNIYNEICVFEKDKKRMFGDLSDLRHAQFILFGNGTFPFKIGSMYDLKDSRYIIFTAGKPRYSSKTKEEDLYNDNRKILMNYMPHLKKKKKRVLLLTNPVEKLAEEFGFTPIGKKLDLARLMTDRRDGGWIVDRKGYSNWGCTAEVLGLVK